MFGKHCLSSCQIKQNAICKYLKFLSITRIGMMAEWEAADRLPEAVWWYNDITLHVLMQLKHFCANIVFYFDCTCLVLFRQLIKILSVFSTSDWHTLCSRLSVFNFYSHKDLFALLWGDPGMIHLIKIRWKQERVELGIYMFIGWEDFCLCFSKVQKSSLLYIWCSEDNDSSLYA